MHGAKGMNQPTPPCLLLVAAVTRVRSGGYVNVLINIMTKVGAWGVTP